MSCWQVLSQESACPWFFVGYDLMLVLSQCAVPAIVMANLGNTYLHNLPCKGSPTLRVLMLLVPMGNAGDTATAAATSPSPPVFSYIDEKKTQRHPGCIIEYYLVDGQGCNHLAATAEDASGKFQPHLILGWCRIRGLLLGHQESNRSANPLLYV